MYTRVGTNEMFTDLLIPGSIEVFIEKKKKKMVYNDHHH